VAVILVVQRQIIGVGMIAVLVAYSRETIASVSGDMLKPDLPVVSTEVVAHARPNSNSSDTFQRISHLAPLLLETNKTPNYKLTKRVQVDIFGRKVGHFLYLKFLIPERLDNGSTPAVTLDGDCPYLLKLAQRMSNLPRREAYGRQFHGCKVQGVSSVRLMNQPI